jgi:regulatory protein
MENELVFVSKVTLWQVLHLQYTVWTVELCMWKQIKKAKDPVSVDEAYAYALRLLEFRFRGQKELTEKLAERGFTEQVISDVLTKLVQLKYIDDNRLLEGLIRQYKEFGFYGPLYVEQKLLGRKFSREEIKKALCSFYPPSDELAVAKQFCAKYRLLAAAAEDQKAKARAMQRLARRGFGPGVVYGLFSQREQEEHE